MKLLNAQQIQKVQKVLKNALVSLSSCLFLAQGLQAQDTASEELLTLAAEVALFAAEVQLLEDENEIENLQRIYGFYIDKQMWEQAADLFSANATIEIGGEGVYQGKDRVLQYMQTLSEEGPRQGVLNEHMQLQPIITVANDGTAKGRWHHFSQEAVHGEEHFWGAGVYENDYVKEDGVWKIQALHLFSTVRTPYDEGWAESALSRTEPSTELAPDFPPSVAYENYPAVFVVPFHYQHPVTGTTIDAQVDPQDIESTLTAVAATMTALEQRVDLLTDADEVEYLHVVYGYYLARNQWDELTGIFAEDGTIEIALRGVYVGQSSVRRNLNLYGVQSELPGILHNHMQYQPVIHVASDGNSALMRSRAFSMMGGYEGVGRWMGGVYENTFVKHDGVWKIGIDRVFNTYFSQYDVGWKDLQGRGAPGVTESNPPDRASSSYFEMYPSAFLPPFHYENPVTGEE